jgi:hypothetical protein
MKELGDLMFDSLDSFFQENLQETIDFPHEISAFPADFPIFHDFPLNQSANPMFDVQFQSDGVFPCFFRIKRWCRC